MDMNEIKSFFQECEEQLAELDRVSSSSMTAIAIRETVNAVFRAVHSITGGAGAFGSTISSPSHMCSRRRSIAFDPTGWNPSGRLKVMLRSRTCLPISPRRP
ncbi:hypothetical protein F2981_09065 [Sinorhizobium meliloti]|nr:hypothetical protein [Sinorhizobium meliloti]